jgi:Tfp pilus assembly protein PilF
MKPIIHMPRNAAARWTWLLACGLLTNAGCLTGSPWSSNPTATAVEEGTPNHIELPAAKNAQLHLTLADSMEKGGHDAEAASCYEKARSLDPRAPNVSRHLAAIYDRMGDSKRALEEYHLALKAAPRDPQLLNRFGYFYYTRGQWKEAEEQYRLALSINANLQHAWVNLGLTLAQQRRYDESLEAFAKAVTRAEALSNLAFVLTTQGQREEAKRKYHEALVIDPNLQIAQLALQKLEGQGVAAAKTPARSATALAATNPQPPPDMTPIVVEGPRPERAFSPISGPEQQDGK